MLVLGIETSCDETGIALYDSEKGLIGHTLHSQIKLHAEYGGVVPELASRDHIRHIIPLIDKLLKDQSLTVHSIDSVAYTAGPGLSGALLVGSCVAEAIACSLNIPSVPIHHLEGHLLAPMLEEESPSFPFLALLVSGGHSQLIHVTAIGDYKIIGDTLDDAAGEAFDKTAQLLGLGYPGGAALSALAEKGEAFFNLPRPLLNSHGYDFSFSGLKTAVLTLIKKQEFLTETIKENIAFEFQEAITDVLVKKSLLALENLNLDQLVVSGGVGANKQLRQKLIQQSKDKNFKVFFPALEFCTDNGAMIALAGALRHHLSAKNDYKFTVNPRWRLSELKPTA
ncbi:MAG: tRNA (adenosine(37)-N6)-threonylcarbamoyltransferase complex transferase subunit TsaD [Methylophilales bacterium]|jgi:N6-L-threonylcarbamoyladenine synthase|nr:tRNA (adenosine(37)-N6)-threonylcarbamoyltransferase complex transferase subunit TsaD [Methylophilales bacterium]